VNVHESVLSRKLCSEQVIENVIKYDLYVKFPRIFAHNVQICAKFCCKNFNDVCQVFRILHVTIILRGAVFSWTRCEVVAFSALSLLVGCQEEHPASEKLSCKVLA